MYTAKNPTTVLDKYESAEDDFTETEAFPPAVLALRRELMGQEMTVVKTLKVANCSVKIMHGYDSVWMLLERPGYAGFALRAAYSPAGPLSVKLKSAQKDEHEFEAVTAMGVFRVQLIVPNNDFRLLRCKVSLTPSDNLLLPFWPRDFYTLNVNLDPTQPRGNVRAAQRGLNTGLVYLTMEEPAFGSLLYFQNYTSLDSYFELTGTTPDGHVGGTWPELGYRMPVSDSKPLPAGKELILSDVFLHWTTELPSTDSQSARIFLDLLAGIYQHVEKSESSFHDWPGRAEETLRDLQHSPKATVKEYGATFLHPYTDAEYPDSMVQLAVLLPIHEYLAWKGSSPSFAEELRKGVEHFYDPKLKTIRRYLPSVGKDKNKNEVDSWYLYHPLANVGRLALDGDKDAEQIFLSSLGYAIKVARHFEYTWPVQFNVETLEIITGDRKECEPGQSDAGGLYAYVMLQAWELTEEKRYLEEAKKAIDALAKLGFSVCYQSNITAWGANACIWLWRITGDDIYRQISYLMLASFFHNSLIYESNLAAAKHYPIFLGVTCLHDGPYMAVYECFESYAAFHEYLTRAHDDVPESVRLLLTEYCKYTPTRAWFTYPSDLPDEAISKEVLNGHIDRKLAFPLEDIYADGKPAGQVGQEIYGSGAAFVFSTRSFHNFENVPFQLYCEYPIYYLSQNAEPCIDFQVRGLPHFSCKARLIPKSSERLPKVKILHIGTPSSPIKTRVNKDKHYEFEVPGNSRIEIRWQT